MAKLPQYKCHKVVRAAIIAGIKRHDNHATLTLRLPGGDHTTVDVNNVWLGVRGPSVGGYFVEYEDGYTSYSPAKAFEDGYTLLTKSEGAS